MPFARHVFRRLSAAIALVALVSIGAFVLGHFAPGDATTDDFLAGAGARAIAEQRARLANHIDGLRSRIRAYEARLQ